MPAAESGPHQQAGLPPAKEGKEKKEKPKSKTAQQVGARPARGPQCCLRHRARVCFVVWSWRLC